MVRLLFQATQAHLPMKYTLQLYSSIALAVTVIFLAPSTVEAGPWTKSTGQYYVKVGQSLYQASGYRDGDGEFIDGIDYMNTTTFSYAEVGVWEDLHLQLYLPMTYARSSTEFDTVSDLGLGDAFFSVQASPLDLTMPTSVRLEVKLPLYARPDPPHAPARGDQQVDLALWLSAGGALSDISLYFYADVGYRHRTQRTLREDQIIPPDYSDAFVYLAQVGYTVADTFDVSLTSSAILPLERQGFDETYITVGPSVFFPISDLIAIEVDGYLTPYARSSAAGWAVGAGISFRGD